MSRPYEVSDPARLAELTRIEKKYSLARLIKTHPSAQGTGIDGTMSRWLSSLLLRAETPEELWTGWQNLRTRSGREYPQDFSEKQHEFLNLSQEEVYGVFAQALAFKAKSFAGIAPQIAERVVSDAGHAFNDRHQVRQKEKRSLERLRQDGMKIQITPEHVEKLQSHLTQAAVCPVLDSMKNEPILTINGFTDSKVALTIHDLFDHFWTFHTFEKHGILARYAEFLQQVGNPQYTDIFKREGELIASIAYEWRSTFSPERAFRPLLSFADMKRHLQKVEPGSSSPNQQRAMQLLAHVDPQSAAAQKLSAMYSGVLIELMEQRRKHGYIRRLSTEFQPLEVLPLMDREYLSLVVEGALTLMQPETQAQDALFGINVLVEDFLIRAAQDPTQLHLSVDVKTLETFRPEESQVSSARQAWLWEHFFHTATRINACA